MNSITLTNVLPQVFRNSEPCGSQVWLQSLTLERGCRVCIAAESGRGKSSLLSFIYGNRRDYDGTIAFDGTDIRTLGIEQWCDVRCRHLALLPQELRLFPELTALQNIDIKNRLTGYMSEERIMEMLAILGVTDRANTPCGRMSVGQQQRVALVRALCQPFDFILLDEPVSHLDRENNLRAAALVEEEATRTGAGIISTSVGNPLLLTDPTVITL